MNETQHQLAQRINRIVRRAGVGSDERLLAAPPATSTGVVHSDPVSIKFRRNNPFYRDLKARVARYFEMTGRSPRDCPQMYVKSLIIFSWAVTSYVLLVFVANAWWQVISLSISLGLAITAVGFNIQHDGNHGSFSKNNSRSSA